MTPKSSPIPTLWCPSAGSISTRGNADAREDQGCELLPIWLRRMLTWPINKSRPYVEYLASWCVFADGNFLATSFGSYSPDRKLLSVTTITLWCEVADSNLILVQEMKDAQRPDMGKNQVLGVPACAHTSISSFDWTRAAWRLKQSALLRPA